MSAEMIGIVITKLRKQKGVTQEAVANAIGVSTQAVSKWENGGIPDVALLPKISDYFEVSLDTLFGRNITDYSSIENALAQKIVDSEPDKRFEMVFEFCWLMERALYGAAPAGGSIKECQRSLRSEDQQYSSIMTDTGYTRMGIANRLQYFLVVPETEDKERAFFNGIDYASLFKDLSDKNVFDALVMLNKRNSTKAFTPKLIMKNLKIEFAEALEIIKTLWKYSLINITQVELDDMTQEMYSFVPTPSFISLLIFAREMIEKPNSFNYFLGGRKKPYLE